MQSALGGRVTIDAAQIGGNIVAILLKAKKTKPVVLNPNPGEYLVPQYNYVAIPVHTKLQESYTYSAEVTRYPVESGSLVSDHVILQPILVDLSFEISNYDGIETSKRGLEAAIKQLESRQPVTLITQHLSLDQMVCTNIQSSNQAPLWGKLNFRASFQQVKQVTLQTMMISPDMVVVSNKMPTVANQTVGEPNHSATQPVNLGRQAVPVTAATTRKAVIFDMKNLKSGLNNSILGYNR